MICYTSCMRRVLFLSFLIAILVCFPTPKASAQTVPSATPLPNLIDLKLQYRQALDDERNKEDQFNIASQQYYALRTLASQEEAVRAGREVDLARVDTILIYIQTLRTTLDTNQGIELSRKNTLQTQFSLLVDALKRHRSRVEIATNRIQIEQENVFMEGEQDQISALCYLALSLIKIGAIQNSLDQLIITQSNVNDYIASANVSETVRTEKQRGSDEVTRSSESIKQTISKAMDVYDTGLEHPDSSLFRAIQETLGPGFSGLTQAAEFIKEL